MIYHGEIAPGHTAVLKLIKGFGSIFLARFALTPLGDPAAGQQLPSALFMLFVPTKFFAAAGGD
jgi:hypothetical protein